MILDIVLKNVCIYSCYPPCITAFLVAFWDNKYPDVTSTISHTTPPIKSGMALDIDIFPE